MLLLSLTVKISTRFIPFFSTESSLSNSAAPKCFMSPRHIHLQLFCAVLTLCPDWQALCFLSDETELAAIWVMFVAIRSESEREESRLDCHPCTSGPGVLVWTIYSHPGCVHAEQRWELQLLISKTPATT